MRRKLGACTHCMTALIKLKWDIAARDYHRQETSVQVSSRILTKMILKETAEDLGLTVIQPTFHFLI